MSRCLRDVALVTLYEGLGRAAERDHVDACPTCETRYHRLIGDMRVIRRSLSGEPAVVRARPLLVRWWAPAIAGLAIVVLANALFVRNWMGLDVSDEPAGVQREEAESGVPPGIDWMLTTEQVRPGEPTTLEIQRLVPGAGRCETWRAHGVPERDGWPAPVTVSRAAETLPAPPPACAR